MFIIIIIYCTGYYYTIIAGYRESMLTCEACRGIPSLTSKRYTSKILIENCFLNYLN